MIKVNYDKDTGKVTGFNRDTEPYIEITEQERRQPLPNKYSYYAVVDGAFTIAEREPTKEERKADKKKEKEKKIQDADKWLNDTEIIIQLVTGEISDKDDVWKEYLKERKKKKAEKEKHKKELEDDDYEY